MSKASYLLLVGALALLAGCGADKPAPAGKTQVSVARPMVRMVVDWDDYVGRFQAIQDVTVTPRVSGTVVQVLFRNGQDVEEGQPLFIVDPRPYRATYDQALAALGRAQAALANAQSEHDRAEKLRDQKLISQEGYETKLEALNTARADVAAEKAAVSVTHLNLDFTTVRSPVVGRVSDRKVSVGDVVTASQTALTRVVTLDPIWFSFEGAESFYLKYARQDRTGERGSSRSTPNPVEIQLADETGYPHRGHMVFVDNAIDTRSGTIRAHAEVANPDGLLTPGMFGRARLLGSGTYEAMLIPDESIVTDQTRRLVFIVAQDGKVEPRTVETGPLVQGLRVVRTGLRARDQVVLDGLARLQPGTVVEAHLTELKPRADDTSPASSLLTVPPASQASEQ